MKNIISILILIFAITACTENTPTISRRDAAIDVITSRVSIRKFTGEKISEQQIDTIVRVGLTAPTAANSQPWAFIVVDDDALLDSLGTALVNSRIKNGASHVIVVCGDMNKAFDGEGRDFWIEDTSAATENILLAAHAMGLGAVWVGIYPMKQNIESVKNILHLPDHIVPMSIVTLGYPAENPAIKDKYKEENIHRNIWQ